jgi:alternate signal-mediated exported protein
MNKTSKGVLAAGAAGMLLLGGAGSLAYWSDTDPVAGSDFNAGSLNLTSLDACNVWNLDTGEPGGQPFDPTVGHIVPGDVITKVCTFEVDAVGEHLRATVDAVPGTNSGALLPSLSVAATNLEIDSATITEITEANHGDVLSVTVAVTFDAASDNSTQELAATLASINIVTQQAHS